ncbi:MAG TPA: glycosyltransferase family 39 protein [Candidatus Binataceae bacterium]|nr:glycosyltransferase family 39 protein [Candidatus Binataceae bacterium]
MQLTSTVSANSDGGVSSSASEGEWQLGTDTELPIAPPPVEPEQPRNRSLERLERPLHILTAEHCGWLLLISYAVFSRLALLGARPLDANEASRALASLSDYGSNANVIPQPGWVNVITVALSALGGPSDWSVRIVTALCGLMLIVVAFGLRRYIGRAGGLALALLLTLSPGFTYYARANAPEMPAALMALLTLYGFCVLAERPSPTRAAWLGIAIGLMSATPPDGRITALSFGIALGLIGLYCLITRQHAVLNIGVWFRRYRGLLLIVVLATVAAWIASQFLTNVPTYVATGSLSIQGDGGGLIKTSRDYLPALALDEFLIVLAAMVGMVAVLSARRPLRSMLAGWVALWTLFSLVMTLALLAPDTANLPLILLPLAVLGALGVEWLHHGSAWPVARTIIGALAVLTLYVQILTNFVYYAPDASEASWNRHANLYWSAMTTTIQTRVYCRRAMAGITAADATVYFNIEAPALRWYLRELRPVKDPTISAVTVGPSPIDGSGNGAKHSDELRRFDFDYAMTWPLTWSGLTPASALSYIFAGEARANPIAASVNITARGSNPPASMAGDSGE